MAINQKSHLGLTLFSVIFIFLSSIPLSLSLPDVQNHTVFEILTEFGLPSGLLPNCVKSYSLSSEGRFVVVLEKPCYVQFEYLVYYDETITGQLSYGSITDLRGIEVKRFFFWLGVDEIRVDLPPSDSIYFQVGIINKKLGIDQFKTVHSCSDSVKGSCLGSLKQVLEFPAPVDEIPMLLTE